MPADLYQDVVLAGIRTTSMVSPLWIGDTAFVATQLAWNGRLDLAFQIVITSHGLLFRTGMYDRFVVDAVFSNRVSLASCLLTLLPGFGGTEVRPICTVRVLRMYRRRHGAVFGLQQRVQVRLPTRRADRHSPAHAPSRPGSVAENLPFNQQIASSPAIARPVGVSLIQCLIQGSEAHFEALQFPEGHQQTRDEGQRSTRQNSTHPYPARRAGCTPAVFAPPLLGRTGAHVAGLQILTSEEPVYEL